MSAWNSTKLWQLCFFVWQDKFFCRGKALMSVNMIRMRKGNPLRNRNSRRKALKFSSRCLHVKSHFYANYETANEVRKERRETGALYKVLFHCWYISQPFSLWFSLHVVMHRIRAPGDRVGSGPFSSILPSVQCILYCFFLFRFRLSTGAWCLLNLKVVDNICNIPHCVLLSWSALWNRHINTGSGFYFPNRPTDRSRTDLAF